MKRKPETIKNSGKNAKDDMKATCRRCEDRSNKKISHCNDTAKNIFGCVKKIFGG